MSARREARDLTRALRQFGLGVEAEAPIFTPEGGVIVELWPIPPTTVAQIEKRGADALRTVFSQQFVRDVQVHAGSVSVYLSPDPAPTPVSVERVAPWRAARIAVTDAAGAPTQLPQDPAYAALRRVLGSDDAYLRLARAARLAESSEVSEPGGTVTTWQVPPLRRIEIDLSGAVMILGLGTHTAQQWESATAAFASALRCPRLRIVPDLAAGVARVELRTVEPRFPAAVALPLPAAAQTAEEARARYRDLTVPLGLDALGQTITWTPRTQPHLVMVSGTGGGKSVMTRGLVSRLLTESWGVMLLDGKTTDYSALRGLPGVQYVSDEVPGHVWMIAAARAELDRRRAVAARRKAAGDTDPFGDFTPLLVLADEWADVAGQIAARYKKAGLEQVQQDMSSLLRVGREAKIHVVIATQELRVSAVPGEWQENLRTVVSLGRPSTQTLNAAFTGEELRATAADLAATIPQNARGRGLIVDASTAEATIFQSLFQFSPGSMTLADAPTPEVREAWAQSAQVLGQRPRLHPRIAPQIDGPDWRGLDVDELRALPPALLDTPGGSPDPRFTRLDPQSPEYIGAEALDAAGAGLTWDHSDTPPTPEPAWTMDTPPMTQGPATSTEPSAEVLGQLVVQLRCAPDDLAHTAISTIIADDRLRGLVIAELTALLRDDAEPTTDPLGDDLLAGLDDLDDLLKGL